MSKFLTLVLLLTAQFSYADLSERVHSKAGELAVIAQDAVSLDEETNFFEFMKLWDETLRISRLEEVDSYKFLDQAYKDHLDKVANAQTIDKAFIENIRISLFREGLESYCSDKPLMSDFIKYQCGNCDAQTRLITAFMIPTLKKLDKDYQFGIQVFTDHIRPVLIDNKNNVLIDLVYGKLEKKEDIDANIYDHRLFYWSYLTSFKLTKQSIDDYLIFDANSKKEESTLGKLFSFAASKSLSFDGYLNFGSHTTKFNKTGEPNPDTAKITYHRISNKVENSESQDRGIENDAISFGFEGEGDNTKVPNFSNQIKTTAQLYEDYPAYRYSEVKGLSSLPFTIEKLSQEKLRQWAQTSIRYGFRFVPSKKLVIRNEKLLKEWENRNIIGKNKLIYSVYRKQLDLLFTNRYYPTFIELMNNPFSIENLSYNEISNINAIAIKLKNLLQFKYDFTHHVIGNLSIGLTGLWQSDIDSQLFQDYIKARSNANKTIDGNEFDFITALSKLRPKIKYLYFEFLKNVRGNSDEIMQLVSDYDTADFMKKVRNKLINEDLKIAKRLSLKNKRIVHVDTSNLGELAKAFKDRKKVEPEEQEEQKESADEDSVITLTAQTYALIMLSTSDLDRKNPRLQQSFLMNLDLEDYKEIQKSLIFKDYLEEASDLTTLNNLNPYIVEEIHERLDFTHKKETLEKTRNFNRKIYIGQKHSSHFVGKDYYHVSHSIAVDSEGNMTKYKMETIRSGCFNNAIKVVTKEVNENAVEVSSTNRNAGHISLPGIKAKCSTRIYSEVI